MFGETTAVGGWTCFVRTRRNNNSKHKKIDERKSKMFFQGSRSKSSPSIFEIAQMTRSALRRRS